VRQRDLLHNDSVASVMVLALAQVEAVEDCACTLRAALQHTRRVTAAAQTATT
jgi:hypothetical protein